MLYVGIIIYNIKYTIKICTICMYTCTYIHVPVYTCTYIHIFALQIEKLDDVPKKANVDIALYKTA